MLEAGQYTDNAFVTLTYDDENLPVAGKRMTLKPKDLQDWLKRYRKSYAPHRFRFFAVGEYGDLSERPHYHLALFGVPTCLYGRSRYKHRANCCAVCDNVRDTWGKGLVDLGTLETSSAQYVAGYVTKKLTARDDPRLDGRHPEFSRQSNRPGIGADAMHDVASTFLAFDLEKTEEDVPSSLRHGSRKLPLGRYLRKRLRKLVGRDEKAPQATLDQMAETLSELRQTAYENSRSFKKEIIKAGDQKVLNQETRTKIFNKGKKTL